MHECSEATSKLVVTSCDPAKPFEAIEESIDEVSGRITVPTDGTLRYPFQVVHVFTDTRQIFHKDQTHGLSIRPHLPNLVLVSHRVPARSW